MDQGTQSIGIIVLVGALYSCSSGSELVQGPVAGPSENATYAPSPDSDEFYVPGTLVGIPGRIVKSREITYQPAGVVLPNQAWQLQYETRDVNGSPLAAVATVVKPGVPNSIGEPVLMSFQHAYDSLGAACTPSRTATGSTSNSTNMAETLEYLPALQTLGWTLVVPDYEGPYHAFGAGRLSGQATLDAIRAALQFAPLGLAEDTRVGLWGYSGGAYATTWAAALQPNYAPELNLVGSVAGGTPVNLVEVTQGAENTESFSLLLGLLFGVARAYPEFLPQATLTEQGRQAIAALRDSCEGNPTDGSTETGGTLGQYVNASEPYRTAGFQAVGPLLDLQRVELYPTGDVFLYHEMNDSLVPIAGVEELVERWCGQGVPVSYYQSSAASVGELTPLGAHTAGAALGTPRALAYLQSRFQGQVAATPVGTSRCN